MLNKLILRAFLSISLALSFAGAANATLISQDILFQELIDIDDLGLGIYAEAVTIGHLSVNLDTLDIDEDGFGFLSNTWEKFSFYTFDVDTFDSEFHTFEAVIDTNNLFAGIEFLTFEVDVLGTFAFNGIIDSFDIENSVDYSLYNFTTDDFMEAGALSFGEATVVPTPATLILFLTALAGLAARRKNS
jgi:hypothetical protein